MLVIICIEKFSMRVGSNQYKKSVITIHQIIYIRWLSCVYTAEGYFKDSFIILQLSVHLLVRYMLKHALVLLIMGVVRT
jgi:hypothetical protein